MEYPDVLGDKPVPRDGSQARLTIDKHAAIGRWNGSVSKSLRAGLDLTESRALRDTQSRAKACRADVVANLQLDMAMGSDEERRLEMHDTVAACPLGL